MITRITGFVFYMMLTGLCAWSTVKYAEDATKALTKID